MKRVAASLAVAVLALLGVVAPVTAAQADVDDFEFASFHADYFLDRDAENHSTLRTVETIVAVFPEFDQNRGIVRTLLDRYDGHPTDLEVVSVTDENGDPVEYETESDDGLALALGGDDYVRGEQTYVIEYTQRHVTRYYDDTDADEFYWDVNGTDWAQPFAEVSATVHLGDGLDEQLTGDVDAAFGREGEENQAAIDGLTFTATDLGPEETLTIAVGFEQGTFVPRESGYFAAPWPVISLVGMIGALAAFLWALAVRRTRLRDEPGRPTIIAEYAPPKDANLLTAAVIAYKSAKSVPAQIIDLAVRGRLRIVEENTEGLFGKDKEEYSLEFLDAAGTDSQELEFLHALFGETLTPGERRKLDKPDSKAAEKLGTLTQRVSKEVTTEGYRRPYPTGAALPVFLVALVTGLVGTIFAIVALDLDYGWPWTLPQLLISIFAVVAVIIALVRQPLTARGAEVRDHMKGLDVYITLAEADRIRFLQSPEGAERKPIADDEAQLVKLNERLLPYAMLFGHEKEWAEELGRHYENLGTSPDWYYGSGTFNALMLANSLNSISTSSASTFTASSGGSGGGAMAGGGGGGGGGGGR
jgi:uncharacterized membrane protein YgcG